MNSQNLDSRKNQLSRVAGLLAGILAGIAFALIAFFVSTLKGQQFLDPLYLIGATFFGVKALVGGLGVAVVGLLTHVAVSAFFGILFSYLVNSETRPGTSLLRGLTFG